MTNASSRLSTLLAASLVGLAGACGGPTSSAPSTAADARDAQATAVDEGTTGTEERASLETADTTEGEPLADELTDARVAVFVLAELVESPAVAAHRVDVAVQDGVATLDGQVDHLLAKRHAIEIAKNVRGVRSVIDALEVAPSGDRDRRIERAVENALLFDPAVDSEQLSVSVDNGTATVTGTVTSIAETMIVDDDVASVAGVRAVELELEVSPPGERSEEELREDLETAYATTATIDTQLMNVSVEGTDVTLSGFVGSAAERDRAAEIAYLAGASSVDAEALHVEWWRRDEMGSQVDQPSDAWIRDGILTAFSIDPRIGEEDHVALSVRRGIVILTGTVDDLMSARAARSAAENTRGVLRVYSYLKARPEPEVTDEMLESRVEARLAADAYADALTATVEVHRGVLSLVGNVRSNFARERAEEAAARVDGLVAIENLLEVREPAHHLSDVELAHDVAARLERDAWVAAGSVVVSSVAGIVSLRGSVSSHVAKRRAIDDAYRAGARRVDAEMLVVQR